MRKKKSASKKPWVDPDDAPELTKEWFERADLYEGDEEQAAWFRRHRAFPRRRPRLAIAHQCRLAKGGSASALRGKFWSGRRDSNPRPQPWQGCALPLSYARIQGVGY